MNTNLTQNSQRFYELDILRFFAALAVVFFHYTFLNATEIETIASFPVLGAVFKYGYLGVELFFIISGFVILLTASKKGWLKFTISRMARLYPAFWIAVSLTFLVVILFGTEDVTFKQYLWNMSMIGSFFGVDNIDPVYWTLQIELKFYFWIFVILIFKKIQHIDKFIALWLLISTLELFHLIHELTHPVLIPEWAPFFSAGALFYLIQKQGITRERIIMLALAFYLSIYYAIQEAGARTLEHGIAFSPYVVAIVVTFFFATFTLIILGKTKNLYRPWFTLLGITTYPLYLTHQKIGQIAYSYIGQSINKYVLLLLMTLFMIFLALLINRYLESYCGKHMKTKLETLLVH